MPRTLVTLGATLDRQPKPSASRQGSVWPQRTKNQLFQRGRGLGEAQLAARQIQFRRLEPFAIYCNPQMTPRTMRRFCKLDSESEKQMENAITRVGLSARAYDRILRVAGLS